MWTIKSWCQLKGRKDKQIKKWIYVRSIPSRECLCSEFSLAQQKRTKEGLGPILAGQRGFAHRRDMKMSGFIRHRRGARDEDGTQHGCYSTRAQLDMGATQRHSPCDHRFTAETGFRKMQVEKFWTYKAVLSYKHLKFVLGEVGVFTSSSLVDSLNVYVHQWR